MTSSLDERVASFFVRIAGAASLVGIAVGCTVLVGWFFHVPILTTVMSGAPSMKANTALCFILIGVSLRLQLHAAANRAAAHRRWIAIACAALGASIGALTLVEYVWGVDLGIDQLIVRAPAIELGTSSRGRMAASTASCFALLGASLSFIDSPKRAVAAVALSVPLLVLVVAFVALAGYAFDARALYGVPGYSSMAVHTAAAFAILAIGIIASRPRRGIGAILAQGNSAGATARRMVPLVIAVPMVVGWFRLEGEQAGLYGTEFGLALTVTVSSMFLASLVIAHARVQGRADEARARAQQQLHLAIESTPAGMLMIDAKGKIVLVNAQVEKLFGYPRDELLGKPVEVLVPERFSAHVRLRDAFLAEPDTRPMGAGRDLFGRHKDGSEIPIEIRLNPLQTADGAYVLSSIADITERKRAEREKAELMGRLTALNAELEERVLARTGELAAGLAEREVLLQEVHHRVKNNLQVIASLMNMQIRQVNDAVARSALAECRTRVQAIALIHEQLYQSKDYSRIPFSEYARSLATNIVHATGTSAGVSLVLNIEAVALGVDKAIPCGLILNELITNALKHAFPDERSGSIAVELRREAGGAILMSVADDGIGLPADFDVARSSSLGMQLVTTLVEQIDGTLEIVRSAGTAFLVRFPAEAPR